MIGLGKFFFFIKDGFSSGCTYDKSSKKRLDSQLYSILPDENTFSENSEGLLLRIKKAMEPTKTTTCSCVPDLLAISLYTVRRPIDCLGENVHRCVTNECSNLH